MRDFSSPHNRKVVHFGIWSEEGQAGQAGDNDAWNILTDAARRCTTEDMRESRDVLDALEWFESRLSRQRPVKDFRAALNMHDPMQRYWAVFDALKHLKQFMGY